MNGQFVLFFALVALTTCEPYQDLSNFVVEYDKFFVDPAEITALTPRKIFRLPTTPAGWPYCVSVCSNQNLLGNDCGLVTYDSSGNVCDYYAFVEKDTDVTPVDPAVFGASAVEVRYRKVFYSNPHHTSINMTQA